MAILLAMDRLVGGGLDTLGDRSGSINAAAV